jgi:hypothetical protein
MRTSALMRPLTVIVALLFQNSLELISVALASPRNC